MRDSLVSLGRLDAPANINPSDSLKRLGVRSMRSATSLPNAHSLSALSCLSQPLGVRPSIEYRRPYSYNSQHSTSFIQDIVIPAKLHSNERNSGASFSRRQPSHCGKQSEVTIRTADTSLQPYVYTKAQSASSAQKKRSKSPQVIRYENEQVDLAQSRLLKRASEVMSHRVDRLYYMCGRSLSATDRYNVDKDELGQLRTLALTRRQHPEYHRKLRKSIQSPLLALPACYSSRGDSASIDVPEEHKPDRRLTPMEHRLMCSRNTICTRQQMCQQQEAVLALYGIRPSHLSPLNRPAIRHLDPEYDPHLAGQS